MIANLGDAASVGVAGATGQGLPSTGIVGRFSQMVEQGTG